MGLWRWGRLADFWPRSGRYEADCPQRRSPSPPPRRFTVQKAQATHQSAVNALEASSKKIWEKKTGGTFECVPRFGIK